MKKKNIYVTKPSLPDLKTFTVYLKKIWDNKIVTNNGPFHRKFEDSLCKYLDVPFVSLLSNGTIGLIIALRALDIKKEVITTPYSFIATSNSLIWNNIKPVFVDVCPNTFNLDPKKIKAAITPNTTAIMPVHVYGNPCDVDEIDLIAKKNNLKVIYDASHAFGVECHCGSILKHGDLSILSFHATKTFNTFEGGAIISKNKEVKEKIDKLKNFGIINETVVEEFGINGKMSEFNAALGLLQLKQIDNDIKKRKKIDIYYRNKLNSVIGITCFSYTNMKKGNYSYFPILVEDNYGLTRDQLYHKLKKKGIYARRYFFPLISDFKIYKSKSSFNIAKKISNKVICLPIYPELEIKSIDLIIKIIKNKF